MLYQYDVFISYSSADRPWALKLAKDLRAKSIQVFLDKDRLDIGKPWATELAAAVQGSKHLVVLWSDNANDSVWVRREVSFFETINDPRTAPQGNKDSRWYAFLMLEGENAAYSGIQGIDSIKEAKAYDKNAIEKGSDKVSETLWQSVVDNLALEIKKNDKSTPIPLAVLAMTKDELDALDPAKTKIWGPDLNSLLKSIKLGDRDELSKSGSYGEQRIDWRPFGHELNVQQILIKVLDEINKEETDWANLKGLPEPEFQFRWELIDPRFWTDNAVATAEQNRWLTKSSTIVIDPISLYDDGVYDAMVTLSGCFNSDVCNIMVLSPFSLPETFLKLIALLERRGRPFFNPHWNPPVLSALKYAHVGVNLAHEPEVRRVLRRSIGHNVRQLNQRANASYTTQGTVT